MPHPSIRTRRPTDLDECVRALRTVHEADAYPLNWPADPPGWLTPSRLLQAWIAAEPDGAVLGHVAVHRLADPGHAELSRLYVIPSARRRSVGSALVGQARSWAAENGYDLTLNVADEHRSPAVAFYEATGWRHSHSTDAGWAAPDGGAVRLRHYAAGTGAGFDQKGCSAV